MSCVVCSHQPSWKNASAEPLPLTRRNKCKRDRCGYVTDIGKSIHHMRLWKGFSEFQRRNGRLGRRPRSGRLFLTNPKQHKIVQDAQPRFKEALSQRKTLALSLRGRWLLSLTSLHEMCYRYTWKNDAIAVYLIKKRIIGWWVIGVEFLLWEWRIFSFYPVSQRRNC